jgi:hypothetical protein
MLKTKEKVNWTSYRNLLFRAVNLRRLKFMSVLRDDRNEVKGTLKRMYGCNE